MFPFTVRCFLLSPPMSHVLVPCNSLNLQISVGNQPEFPLALSFCHSAAQVLVIPLPNYLSFRSASGVPGERSLLAGVEQRRNLLCNSLSSVPHMIDRHRLNLEHQVRRDTRQRARKLPRSLLAAEEVLLLDASRQPTARTSKPSISVIHAHLRNLVLPLPCLSLFPVFLFPVFFASKGSAPQPIRPIRRTQPERPSC